MVLDVEKMRLQWRLVIWVDALFVNAMFRNGTMRCEVGTDKVVSGCKLSGMLLDDDKKDHVMRSRGRDITFYLFFKNYWF